MKKPTLLLTALAITLQISCAIAGVPRTWDADVGSPAAFQTSAWQGETIELAARLVRDRVPFAVPAGATAGLWWKTNGMDRYWGPAPATVSTNGVVSASWAPTNDVGAASYRGFLGVSLSGDGSNLTYAANFTLRMLESPGFAPNSLPLPVQSIDFSLVEVANAPWIEEESDPTVPAWARAAQPPLPDLSGYATTGAVAQVAAGKQDRLPYATNAIPYSAIADRPDIPSTNGFIKVELDPTVPDWAKSASAPLPPDYAAVSNAAMNAARASSLTNYYTKAQVNTSLSQKANDNAVVKLSGTQTIEGDKIFKGRVEVWEEEPNMLFATFHPNFIEFSGDGLPRNYLYFPNKTGTLALTSDIPTAWAWSAITDKPTFAAVATSGSYSDLSGRPSLATVATSGSYNDLSNRPAIPSTNGFIKAESDPTVPTWAKAASPPDPPREDIASQNVVKYASGVLTLSIAAGATVSATTNSPAWPDGGAVFARIRPAGAYSVAQGIQLLGYGDWPTNSAEAVFVRSGGDILCSVLREGR